MNENFGHDIGSSGVGMPAQSFTGRAALLDDLPSDQSRHDGQLWMVTFADLAALVLAFFVLLYSMSRIDEQSWQQLVEGTGGGAQLDRQNEQNHAAPADDESQQKAASLNYVSALLKQQADQSSAIRNLALDASGDALVIEFHVAPESLQNSTVLDAETTSMFEALARVLGATENALEIMVFQHRAPHREWSDGPWTGDLQAGRRVHHWLRDAGYQSSVRVTVHPFANVRKPESGSSFLVRIVADKFVGRPVQS